MVGREQALHCRRVTIRFRSTCEAKNRDNLSQKYMKIDPKIFFLRRGGPWHDGPPPLNTPLISAQLTHSSSEKYNSDNDV